MILSQKPQSWDAFVALIDHADIPSDFLDEADRNLHLDDRDPFAGFVE